MSYLTEAEVQERAVRDTVRLQKSARTLLIETAAVPPTSFDIFLTHSAESEELLLGIKALLEDQGLKVYVDNYGDPQVSPVSITPFMAGILRDRMRQANVLLYVHSRHSRRLRWMPWELGFFDGLKGAVGFIPVTHHEEETFRGEEYLNLYPYVDVTRSGNADQPQLWIRTSADVCASLRGWVRGTETLPKRS
jgi:hypothetical protein